MAPRVPNTRVPDAKVLLRDGVGRSKYVPKAENSEFSITRITPQNALNLVRKFSDEELKTQYSKREIEILHDEASKALSNEIINITGRDSEGNIANFNKKSIEWLLQNNSLIDRLAESGSRGAQSLGIFRDVKIRDLKLFNPKLYEFYDAKSWIRYQDGIYINNPETHEWTRYPNVLTEPPKDLPQTEVAKANMLNEDNTPAFLTRKGEAPSTVPAAENPAAASPSPEAIHEAMADAVAKDKSIPKDDTVVVPPEAAVEEAAKGTADAKATTENTEAKVAEKAEDKATPETAEKGALTGEPKGFFSKIGGHFKRNLGKYLLGGIGIGAASGIVDDLASDNSRLKTPFTGSDVVIETNNPSGNQPRVKSLDQREGAYMPERLLRFTTNEEYVPGKIPSHIPQDNLPLIKESTNSKKVKNQPQQQERQSQVVNAPAPVNNATADYVRAAYNSYIPSDAGRAYQKAIYGDPLELDRMRLQQQQQKWRDFVMRSGQSPAELVQRGLMPYDALQYV